MPPRHLADLAGTRRSQFRINPDSAPGAPTSGYHQIGEIHMDSLGSSWICTVTGTPGTWVRAEGAVTGQIAAPASLQILDTVAIATYRTTRWALECRKGSDILIQEIVATHDGSSPADQRPVSMQMGTGTFDVTITVDISGGNLRLTVTPATTGWTLTWKRIYSMAA